MSNQRPLYNSRMIKVKVEYLEKAHPDINIDTILGYAGILPYQMEDRGHWLYQKQVDRFSEKSVELTGDKAFDRKSGRYMAVSENLAHLKQYTLGLLSPRGAYLLMGLVLPMLARHATVKTRNAGPRTVEITVRPNPGVHEKHYQCEHRVGCFEAVGQLFTGSFASVDHPDCVHRGDKVCRYRVAWEDAPSSKWKKSGTAVALVGLLSVPFLVSYMPNERAALFFFGFTILALSFFVFYFHRKGDELSHSLKIQGEIAKDQIDEINLRYSNLMLVQEIAQITSDILDVQQLIHAVLAAMERRLDFDRGMVMLAEEGTRKLCFVAGYGYGTDLQEKIQRVEFNLKDPSSKGVFVKAFLQQKPLLVENVEDIIHGLSPRSSQFATVTGAKSLICVPIQYERKSLGILVVDNVRSKRPLTQSDIGLLTGVATQAAASVAIARSFEKLVESERKYRDLVENASSIILRRDIHGRITFFNEFAQKLFGYAPEEIIGRDIVGAIFPDTEQAREEICKTVEVLKQTPEFRMVQESEHRLNTGEALWITWTHRPVLDSEGKLIEILCIGNDISQMKRDQLEKKRLEEKLHRAEKMEALGTLAGGVAHDLNNVLAGIVGYPDLLLMQLPEESPMRKAIQNIKKSGEKASAIVQDLLTLARRSVPVSETINLNHIASEYMSSPENQVLRQLHPRVRFETHLEEGLLNIVGSPLHLSKTLMNLVTNAAEAIDVETGGSVVVRTENRFVDQPIRGYDNVRSGDYVVLVVEDTGTGIRSEDLDRIFEPFYTRKKMGKSGTGLGMAVVWGTVKDHNGYINVESTLGDGTKFSLYFSVDRDALVTEKDSLSWEMIQGKGENILVVDDMEDQREVARSMLQTLGYTVKTAASGEDALLYLKDNRADLLLLDMMMAPGMDGLETYTSALEIRPEQKAIIASGFSESHRVKKAQRLGAGAFIRKPYLLETIGEAVRKGLDNERGV